MRWLLVWSGVLPNLAGLICIDFNDDLSFPICHASDTHPNERLEDSSVLAGAREIQVLRHRHLDLIGFGNDVF
jgi:hypothetical protein